jgi:hypothetical protein
VTERRQLRISFKSIRFKIDVTDSADAVVGINLVSEEAECRLDRDGVPTAAANVIGSRSSSLFGVSINLQTTSSAAGGSAHYLDCA